MLRCILLTVLIAGGFEGATSESSPKTPGQFILGGKKADIKDHPYQLSLQTDYHVCGATVIDKKWALTAAQCVGSTVDQYKVRAGSSEKDEGTIYPVKTVIRHPNYVKHENDYDIALLEIDGTIEFNDNVKAIPLVANEPLAGSMTNITGWGAITEGGQLSQCLLQASVPIVDRNSCRQTYNVLGLTITDRMICAGCADGGRDACQGDNGGPMTYKDRLCGIVSWSYGCARPNYPGVYTNIAHLRQWILETSGLDVSEHS